jgi:hypothetical protein
LLYRSAVYRLLLFALFSASLLPAYSVLSHEAIIDTCWDGQLKPLLLRRFPKSTPDELRQAHAYAYGGSIIQDMGYYPFGSRFFSDLVHYVRSGDFPVSLLKEARDRNEYAFALGALAHYAADTQGHSVAVNRAVALEFPKLRRKFGDVITFYQKPSAHMRVEFAFDVVQVARGHYAPQSYRDFIGFEVSRELLDRAFRATYSLELADVFTDLDLALGTYRRAVSEVIPRATRVAWKLHEKEIDASRRQAARQSFVFELSKSSYRKEWKERYREPGIFTRTLALLLTVAPKIGPLKVLRFHTPSPESDRLFQASFTRTLDDYRELLAAHRANRLQLENRDFDTGAVTHPGEYPMADEAYGELAIRLAKKNSRAIDPAVRRDILTFFRDVNAPFSIKSDPKEWRATLEALGRLKSSAAAASN